ncbi:MazG-like family protein [Kitasatospora cheerisanensis]|uniref:Phosphoribosyl-ATP diphosphatase n=1 Tax=Kitasatospora cheerisanensis KCTC 2395 TaxID=1348663 RepID=A0A066YJE9_9ACTN|nr:MazG-like family protein [Kitasatospora cheerisanensis]KDN81272.1 phosphoribosyl-ATP diphosphatase [Kitasatospora cheerisanensis KCTC 2395]
MEAQQWETVQRLAAWLAEGSTQPPEMQRVLQCLKIGEEAGEVAEAVIGAMGQNPRKGYSHTWDDVAGELCDVVITAMVALVRVHPDPAAAFDAHLAKVAARSLPAPVTDPASH